MAGRAICGRVDLPIILDLLTDGGLGFSIVLSLPFQVGNFVHRAEFVLRIVMALKAPSHALVFVMEHDWHFTDVAVAADAGNPAADVDAVLEISVIRSFVDFHPLDWFAGFHAFLDDSEVGGIRFHVLVTVPAGGTRRHIGDAGLLHKTVAISAVHAHLAHVNFVRKGHRLIGLVTDTRVFLREIISHSCRHSASDKKEAYEQLQREEICPARKEIGHSE